MNRPIGPAVDVALLASKLSSARPDLAVLQTEVGTSMPVGPMVEIQKVKNDVRLPSHAMLEARLPAGAAPAPPRADAPPSIDTQWSAAARVISAVLADLDAESEPVRGAAPVWASPQEAPSGAVLAAALARSVSGSGLFYESHLLEFAMGLRTLSQLAEEPQVRLTQPLQQPATAAAPLGQPVLAVQPAAAQAPAAAPLSAAGGPAPAPSDALPQALPSAQIHQAAVASATHMAAMAGGERMAGPGIGETGASASSARAAAPAAAAAELIHPQTATLVHQQLDLLATAVFRWSGQAWPNVPMAWSIHEETAEQPDHAPEDRGDGRSTPPRRWTTTVSLTLPKLGAVDLRLSLTGELVQAHLAASQAATLARLRSGGGELAPRLEAAGLRLQDLQITAMERTA
ncbi:putative flagellar hook-length control protein FliK [Variovorax paradoxus B4]|uniref:Putative flagellar hook-length control protein FliK n=1 Tax=Variovorax paradoxus B4 TaxID=1246301 RepID=T1XGB9_VARPD|nr:flagellar hook-length control protein FliK [Variovorax paradoxus]AGU51394.1 putative flagellar hook-length control protein FliK [Variovorax paradoxus B4]